jgi:type I restriction enzyme S subunit
MKWRAYPGYKPSGVEWLGEVPEHWDTLECKFGYSIQLGKMLQNGPQMPNDEQVPYLKALYVQWENVRTSDLPEMWASPGDILKYSVRDGDLLVCEGGEVGRAGILRNPPARCIIQNALHYVRPKGGNSNRFLMYLLKVASFQGWFDILCNKATIAHFTGEKFGSLSVTLPSPHEQRAIAAFLDRKTERIDALITKVQESIDLLKEKRTALISHAVIKGLAPPPSR